MIGPATLLEAFAHHSIAMSRPFKLSKRAGIVSRREVSVGMVGADGREEDGVS